MKLKAPNEATATITDEDKSIASLKSLIVEYSLRIEQLEGQITSANNDAHRAIHSKMRVSARAALRSKKMAEADLARILEVRSQLESAYDAIQQASDQLVITSALKGSANVLRKLNEETGNVETIEEILDELKSEVDKTREISEVISGPADNDLVDESAIDDELEELVQSSAKEESEKTAQQTALKLDNAPNPRRSMDSVPVLTESPAISKLEEGTDSLDSSLQDNMQALGRMTLDDVAN